MPDYNFTQRIFDGHDFGELESRKRVCVIATSKGLPILNLDIIRPVLKPIRHKVQDFLLPIADDSDKWREMAHVKARDHMKHLGYKNCLYRGEETKMVTLPASYASPKAGSPMIAHPHIDELQRQITAEEHMELRDLPAKLKETMLGILDGSNSVVTTRGSSSACHRLLGNGVSKQIWTSVGAYLGLYFADTVS
jgi:DNA (cytosine-5)-methyltransferase 1